ncbi:MAG TPA: hypothetical protein ENI97_01075 [Gammaproteobacteria bacterium]|nr:hypothetical protein [Gammaproteobacteria bacterium]
MSTETKLASARTRLILDKPFLGALVLRLPMQEANTKWCPTTATDAYNNAKYCGSAFPVAIRAWKGAPTRENNPVEIIMRRRIIKPPFYLYPGI